MNTFVALELERARAQLLAELVVIDAHARRERGEVQEIAGRLRQILDLLLRDVGRHFRRLHFHEAIADDLHLLDHEQIGRDGEIGGDSLPEHHLHGLRLRLVLRERDGDFVGAGPQSSEREGADVAGDRGVLEAALRVARRYGRAGQHARLVPDRPLNVRRRRLAAATPAARVNVRVSVRLSTAAAAPAERRPARCHDCHGCCSVPCQGSPVLAGHCIGTSSCAFCLAPESRGMTRKTDSACRLRGIDLY